MSNCRRYAWLEPCPHVVLEADPGRKFPQICETLAAIERAPIESG
jgi:hypothetical protein